MFDFEVVKKQIEDGWDGSHCYYSKEEIQKIFEYFYKGYEKTFGKHHPFLKLKTIEKVMDNIIGFAAIYDLEFENIFPMIDKYFDTRILNCDYSIVHFSQEKILENRYYEVVYQKL